MVATGVSTAYFSERSARRRPVNMWMEPSSERLMIEMGWVRRLARALLHDVEGLTSAQIARQLGIPDGTVRRRLKTALDQLRAQLQARNDQPGRGWLAALVPLANATEPAVPPSTLLGVLLMKKIIAIAVVLVLVVAGALLWRFRAGNSRAVPSA